mgnify:CR=1 FL=1
MSHGLNDRLNTAYIDINEGDTSFLANQTRSIAACVGRTITPRQILIILRILKALTYAFLVFTLIADLMYIFFVEFFANTLFLPFFVEVCFFLIVDVFAVGLGDVACVDVGVAIVK